ncbi:hypothetical protein BE04_22885 [Sorangium cellulosum]|uniref:Uncharacterized protein n=1 Tax=Sorangium cellulosum TaxID=56 RepID=A0A150PEG0_SORCE|nr:hypothetical protein BE04_22885 [Sorangium cellulosum]
MYSPAASASSQPRRSGSVAGPTLPAAHSARPRMFAGRHWYGRSSGLAPIAWSALRLCATASANSPRT